MDTASEISVSTLRTIVGTPAAPLVIDVRRQPAFDASEHLLPAALRCDPGDIAALAPSLQAVAAKRGIVVYCVHGHEVGQNAAATLREHGLQARHLAGGIEGWREYGAPTLRKRRELGIPGAEGSKWVTRERPKIDRIACPWLIRRFIDANARFLYVPAGEVLEVAREQTAIPYDVPGVEFSHEGDRCSFDAVLRNFELSDPVLDELAAIVRGADTGKPELTPQSPGLLAVSLGLSVIFPNDLEMLEQGMIVYDALYAWLRSARFEAHNADLFRQGAA